MLPRPKETITKPTVDTPQQGFTPVQASQIMAKKAGHADTPLDVFGWSAQWLVGVLHKPQSNPIVDALSRLVDVTAAGNLPEHYLLRLSPAFSLLSIKSQRTNRCSPVRLAHGEKGKKVP